MVFRILILPKSAKGGTQSVKGGTQSVKGGTGRRGERRNFFAEWNFFADAAEPAAPLHDVVFRRNSDATVGVVG